jgi:outer membrane protein assembly factor BamD
MNSDQVWEVVSMKRVSGTLKIGLGLALVVASLSACTVKEEPEYVERPVSSIYNSAMNFLQDDYYRDAAREFDEVERQHPYSVWATKAQLMAAYAYYQSNRYDDAIIALDRFTQLHPANREVSYAYYLKALCYYEQISDVARDQKMTELALASLSEVIKRFPESQYARDAKVKIDLTHDHLAGKEMSIGRYYLAQKQYLAAINRFKAVVEKYDTTTHVPEALHRLTEAYLALGITSEARKSASVLGHNFPNSEWYEDSYFLFEGKPTTANVEKPWYKIW